MGVGQYLVSLEHGIRDWIDMYKHVHVIKFGSYP